MEKLPDNRFTGCLLGGAIGDALGAPVEFMSLEEILRVHGPRGVSGYCEYADHTGEFTDDTQMTLFTAEALLRAYHRTVLRGIGANLPRIAADSYTRWLLTQGITPDKWPGDVKFRPMESGWLIKQNELYRRRAPGTTCQQSIRSGEWGSPENPINHSKGCGAIMRMAPVGLVFNNPEIAFKTGCELAALTHGHPSGYLSAGTFAAIIQELGMENELESSIHGTTDILRQWTGHEETLDAVSQAVELYHQTQSSPEPSIVDMARWIAQLREGWVGEEALAISLFCSLHYQHDFRNGVLASVNHSGDSDSTGSITGNILGLINGIEVIPEKWIKNLKSGSIVRQIGEDLYTRCKSEIDDPDQEWWDKYPGY